VSTKFPVKKKKPESSKSAFGLLVDSIAYLIHIAMIIERVITRVFDCD